MTQWELWNKRSDKICYSLDYICRLAGISRQTKRNWKLGTKPQMAHVIRVEEVFARLEGYRVA